MLVREPLPEPVSQHVAEPLVERGGHAVLGEVGGPDHAVAAAHAATGLHTLLGVIAASQDAIARGDTATLAAQTAQTAQTAQLRQARQALTDAVANTDILLDMLKSVGL